MYKTRVGGGGGAAVDSGKMLYVEMDPSHRYGRFKDLLGKGAMKTVYRAFDEYLGTEVAWNQVKLNAVFGSPEELQRLYSEVHLLNSLKHDSIMKFRASWIDVDRRTFNFITEMFTSGTLREYRKKYKRLNIRAIKDWARQILEGLNYLHSHDPPVIHRDLKCDNVFVNGHLGQVKIGDLGLAAILHGSHQAHSVIGTPEFMAPELYEEEYDELVDIYSFGMCVLEMLTCEYPYSECSNPAQIYKKVTSGKLPEAFHRIDDAEARRFVGRCLEKAPNRPSASELLMDPFLSIEEVEDFPASAIPSHKAAPTSRAIRRRTDMSITGTLNPDDDTIDLRVQISDKDGPRRNVFFPFDIRVDTCLEVATEMVKELEIADWEPLEIANMIEEELSTLVPSWQDSTSCQILKQHSFEYADSDDEDNDDNRPHHPFYPASSFSSSQASLPGFSLNETNFYGTNSVPDWLNEEANGVHDDASSQTSSYSDLYSNLNYYSLNEEANSHKQELLHPISKTQKCTRFCPEGSKNALVCNSKLVQQRRNVVRTGSMVDIRSQLLHQKFADEINKRHLFRTVGAVENIGYRDPDDFPSDEDVINSLAPGKPLRKNGTTSSNWLFKW